MSQIKDFNKVLQSTNAQAVKESIKDAIVFTYLQDKLKSDTSFDTKVDVINLAEYLLINPNLIEKLKQ
jgi:hypothetical protein